MADIQKTWSPNAFSFFSFILIKRKLKASPRKVQKCITLFYTSVPSGTMNFLICKTKVNRRCSEQYLEHGRYSINVNQLLFVNAVFAVWNTTK